MSTRSAKVNFLLDLAFRVPPLLEKTDTALNATEHLASDTSSLSASILTLKKTFETWLQSFSVVSRLNQHQQTPPPREDAKKNTTIHDLTCESLCRICLLLLVEGLAELETRNINQPDHSSPPTFNTEDYANELRKTATLFTTATKIPVVKARGVSGSLHFLDRYYFRIGDVAGTQWCLALKERVCREAPYLSWEGMLPWSLLTLYAIPLRTTEVVMGKDRCALI
jgi:hypothetical protein